MHEFGEAIGWPARQPGWVGTVLLMGLISLIPVAGAIALLGWMLRCLDHLREGRSDLPPAGFGSFGRGLRVFAVMLVYGLSALALLAVLFGLGFGLASAGAAGGGRRPAALAGFLLVMLGWAAGLLVALAAYFLTPLVVLLTDGGGMRAGLDVARVLRLSAARPQLTLMAGLMTLLAHVVGGLGGLLCGFGYFLTIAYGYAMLAGVIRVYEQQAGVPLSLPPRPAAPPPAAPA